MATYVLLPGAGGSARYWHLVARRLSSAGHRVVPVELPAADDSAGLAEYAEVALAAVAEQGSPAVGTAVAEQGGPADGIVLVAQSLGGFTAPLLCARLPVALLVLVNAMVPAEGEAPGDWWANTGHGEAIRAQGEHSWSWDDGFDPAEVFLHDLPPELAAELMAGEAPQSGTPFERPWPPPGYPSGWPDVPTRFLQGRDDRFFPIEFQRRVVRERLGVPVDEMPGGHLMALSRPAELAQRLEAYRTQR